MALETEERHRLPHRRQMLPRKCEAVGLCRTSLFFASRTLGTAVTGSADNATPDHLLPQAATSLQIHCFKRTTDLLCRQKDQEVCQQLRISPRTLQTLRDNGTLAYSQIGHKIFYKPEDVQRIVRLVEDRRKDTAYRGCSI